MPRPRNDYLEIKLALDEGLSKKDICVKFKMHRNTLRYILRTRNWEPKCIETDCDKPRWLQSKRCETHAKVFRLERNHIENLTSEQRDSRSQYGRQYFTGFTADMFAECLEIQEGLCGLCGIELDSLDSQSIHADHVPGSNPPKPRGILCNRCNAHWLGKLEDFERNGDCQITNPQLIAWQTNPPMARSSFAEELGWLVCA